MRHNNYYPLRQAAQSIWLGNFGTKLPTLAGPLGLSAAQVAAAVADCGWLGYLLQTWLPAVRNFPMTGTSSIIDAQTGTETGVLALPIFVAPALPNGVVPVAPGALNRIFALVQTIRDSGKCSDTNALVLGITGVAQSGPDMATIQPIISVSIMGSQVQVKWGWGGNSDFLDSCEIQVDRADGKGFGLLTIDTTPGYTDTQPFPATSVKWTYKAIYRLADAQVGLWSQTASVMVPA